MQLPYVGAAPILELCPWQPPWFFRKPRQGQGDWMEQVAEANARSGALFLEALGLSTERVQRPGPIYPQ